MITTKEQVVKTPDGISITTLTTAIDVDSGQEVTIAKQQVQLSQRDIDRKSATILQNMDELNRQLMDITDSLARLQEIYDKLNAPQGADAQANQSDLG